MNDTAAVATAVVDDDVLTKLLTRSSIKSLSTEDRMDELLAWIRENKRKQAAKL